MKRTPLRRVSKKRAKEYREYSKLRKEYLELHPYCQATILLNGFNEEQVIAAGGLWMGIRIPRSVEIHHVAKRRGAMLNDTSKWLAVSTDMHRRIEDNKSWARANGLLDNF